MSRSVDLFIDSALPPERVAAQITDVTGIALSATPEGTWALRQGEVTAELTEHRYADDGDLWLTRYRYALSAQVISGANPKDSPQAALLRAMVQALHQRAAFAVLLVLDLQYRDVEEPSRD